MPCQPIICKPKPCQLASGLTWGPCDWTTDGSTVSVNSREGCVTNRGANCLNSSGRQPFARSPAKPVVTFVYTDYSMEAHLNKLNSPHFTEKLHFLCTISKTNNYPLQKTWVFPMTSLSYTCFLKGICKCVAHWFGLVYATRVWHSAYLG